MAGNVCEWTMEAYESYPMYFRIVRGGSYGDKGSDFPASSRIYGYLDFVDNTLGFRPSLYLK